MFEKLIPEKFCKEFVEANGSDVQLTMFMAVVLGQKPLMDDWIEPDRLPAFKKACEKYGLYLREESKMLNVNKDSLPDDIPGKEFLTSTIALGFPLNENVTGGLIHVFISRNPELLSHGMWYPVIIKKRIFWPPYADILEYGKILGYPECCIRFFRQKNDWNKYSFLAEIKKATTGISKLLANTLLKDTAYSLLYHMPCRFDCPATVKQAEDLLLYLRKKEPKIATSLERHLGLPVLVLYEKKIFAFNGKLIDNKIEYSEVYPGNPEIKGSIYHKILASGNVVIVEGKKVFVYKGREFIGELPVYAGGFAPEEPFVIQFRDINL